MAALNLTVRAVRELYTADYQRCGGGDSSLQARYYARPISYYIAWLFIRIGITPNKTTISALVTDIAGCLCIAVGVTVLGAVLVNIGHLLDYVDGTIARATNTVTDFGKYLDRTCDEIVEVVIPTSIGLWLYFSGCSFMGLSSLAYLVMGFSYAMIHLLSTLSILHVKLTYKKSPNTLHSREQKGLLDWVYWSGINLKSTATPILLLATFIPNGLPIFLIGFLVLTICEFVFGFVEVVKRR